MSTDNFCSSSLCGILSGVFVVVFAVVSSLCFSFFFHLSELGYSNKAWEAKSKRHIDEIH